MGRGRLSEEEIKMLRENPYVSDVDEKRIIYTNEFKFLFMEEYNRGKKPTQIFRDAGFEPSVVGAKRIERATNRWRASYEAGSLGRYQNGTLQCREVNENTIVLRKKIDEFQKEINDLRKQIELLQDENQIIRSRLSEIEKNQ